MKKAQACRARLEGSGPATEYAASLLTACGIPVTRGVGPPDPPPAVDWALSGAMALTGEAGGPPRLAPGPLASCARGALAALAALSPEGSLDAVDGPALLGERAARRGLTRRGSVSPGGSCRLLPAVDGWIALNLARPEDRALLPAWLEERPEGDPWVFVGRRVSLASAEGWVARGRLLGLPVALAGPPAERPPPWCRIERHGRSRVPEPGGRPLVLDLGALWAGPLCTALLERAGARVLKVESRTRPDGARRGEPGFFDRMNAGKSSLALDFGTELGRAQLAGLVDRADVVVESARPRALAQLGIDATQQLAGRPGLTWVSLTGYGRSGPPGQWVAFGDDAAAAAGLAWATGAGGPPVFCGDAIADPLAGLHAAVAALAGWRSGGGVLIDVPLRDVVAHALAFGAVEAAEVVYSAGHWRICTGGATHPVRAPRARASCGRARPLGADTRQVLEELGLPC